MTHFWDKFGVPIARLKAHTLSSEHRVKLARYVELLGELLSASEDYTKLRVLELFVGEKNAKLPLPELLVGGGKRLVTSTPQEDEALARILEAACSGLHSFDHRNRPFRGYPALGHPTEQYLRWIMTSRSREVSPELRLKAKEFEKLDYPTERRLWDSRAP